MMLEVRLLEDIEARRRGTAEERMRLQVGHLDSPVLLKLKLIPIGFATQMIH